VTVSTYNEEMLRLSLVLGLGTTLIRRCLESFGSPAAVINASLGDLVAVEDVGPKTMTKVLAQIDSSQTDESLVLEKQLIEEHGVSLYSQDDDQYPRLLRHIPDPPPLLFVKGQTVESDAVSLAVVSARRCTQYGRVQAARLATLSSRAGLRVVSGGHTASMRRLIRQYWLLGGGQSPLLVVVWPDLIPKNTRVFLIRLLMAAVLS